MMVDFEEQVARMADGAPDVLGRALRHGGTFAEVFIEHSVHHRGQLVLEARGRRSGPTLERHVVQGGSVRVLDGTAWGFAVADGCARASLLEAADRAAAQVQRAGRPASTPEAIRRRIVHLETPPDAPDVTAASEKEALLRTAAGAALLFDDRVQRVEVGYQDRTRRVGIVTAGGCLGAEARTLLGLRVRVMLKGPEGPVWAHAVAGGPGGMGVFFGRPPEHVAREAVERARRRVEALPLASGVMPVVLAAGWGGVWLHEAVGHALEADVSPYRDRLGEQVAPAFVTIVDDPTLPEGRGSCRVDDEGTPAGPTPLIEDGYLHALLTDRRQDARHDAPLTGNARRQDVRHPPLPRMTNLVLRPGDATPEDLIADVRDGLFVRAIGQGTTQPDGTFAFDVLDGVHIEDGRLTHAVADVHVTGQGARALEKLVGVGTDLRVDAARGICEKDGQVVPVSVGMPTVLLRDMQVEVL